MKVNGYEVPPEVVEICLARMAKPGLGLFRAEDIALCAEASLICKVGWDLDDLESNQLGSRIADRLIQRQRKAKHIKKANQYPYWEAVRP